MRSVAERLVLRTAATAQGVMLARRALTPLLLFKFDAARDAVGAIFRDRDRRRPLLIALFDTVDRKQILQSRPESTDRRSRALARQINGTGFGQLGLWLSIERIRLRKRWRPRRFQSHEQQDSCG